MKLSRKRILFVTVVFVFLLGFIFTAVYLKSVADYKKAVAETNIGEIDISGIPDGVYAGEYDVNFIYVKVEVTVQSGEMTNITLLEHKQERGKAAEAIVQDMIAEQKIDVDAVSGATNSSIVIKKAVENALRNAVY